MGQQIRHLTDEADIGSGEKTPGQQAVEREEQRVPPNGPENGAKAFRHTRPSDGEAQAEGRILQDGTHLARIVAVAQPNGFYEAQVYVRLTREPEVAETYIPAGTYPTEAEAWAAAEERAQRAFKEKEF